MELWILEMKEGKEKQWEKTPLGTFPDPNQPLTLQILEVLNSFPDKKEVYIVFDETEEAELQEDGKKYYYEDKAKTLFLKQVVSEYIYEHTAWSASVRIVQEDPNVSLARSPVSDLRLGLLIHRKYDY